LHAVILESLIVYHSLHIIGIFLARDSIYCSIYA